MVMFFVEIHRRLRKTAAMMSLRLAALVAVAALLSACHDEDQTTVSAPSLDCICAQACGVPIVSNSFWVNAQGQAVALGNCPALHDEIILENRGRCQCAQPVPGLGTFPRKSPNH